jgi:hypothetical protein
MADRNTQRASGRGTFIPAAILFALLVLAGGFWFAVLPGLSVARQEPVSGGNHHRHLAAAQ